MYWLWHLLVAERLLTGLCCVEHLLNQVTALFQTHFEVFPGWRTFHVEGAQSFVNFTFGLAFLQPHDGWKNPEWHAGLELNSSLRRVLAPAYFDDVGHEREGHAIKIVSVFWLF